MVPLATGPVFAAWAGVDRGPLDSRPAIDDLVRARNDLQPGAISLCPPIADVLTALAACGGALLSRMSGSGATRSEEHTSELQSLMRNSYAVFCLKQKNKQEEAAEQQQNTIITPNTKSTDHNQSHNNRNR